MNSTVFISGSIGIQKLPFDVNESLYKIMTQNMTVLVGDASGVDCLIQNFFAKHNYFNVTICSIYSNPRYIAHNKFKFKYIQTQLDSGKERERQQKKDEFMTMESDYSFIIWNGKSKGSYQNIIRALNHNKKIKVYLDNKGFLESFSIVQKNIDYIFRENNGYTAPEVVTFFKESFCFLFNKTQDLHKYLLEKAIISKTDGIYIPNKEYEKYFFIDSYKGKITGIRFKNEFISWLSKIINRSETNQPSLF